MTVNDDRLVCGEPFPHNDTLTCVKNPGHEDTDNTHATCLGAHDIVDSEGRPTGEHEYEWAEWPVE